jgi:two-component system sensor histidine kinase YesM
MKRKSLSRQIYGYFLIVIVLSLVSVGAVSYVQSSRALDDQVKQYMEQMIDSANYQTDSYLQAYELLSNAFSSNSDVRAFMEIKPDDAYEYYVYSDKIKKFALASVESIVTLYKQLNMIYVTGQHGRSVIYENQNLFNFDPVLVQEKYTNLMKLTPGDGKIALLNMSVRSVDQGAVVTMARKVRGPSYGDANRGVVAIEIKLDELAKTWDRVSLGSEGFFFIVDDAGNYIYPRSMRKPKDELASQVLTSGNQTFLSKYNGEERMFVSRKSGYSDWNLVASMPVKELRRPANTIRTTTIIVGLVTLAATLWLASRFRQVHHRYEQLRKSC